LIIGLSNAGSAISGITGVLRSNDIYTSVTDSLGFFGDLAVGDTIDNHSDCFTVAFDSLAPIGHVIEFELLINGTADYACTLQFSVMVGDSMNLPTGPDAYGYYAYDNTDTHFSQCPGYSWVEIRGIGTQLSLGDDQTVQIDLPQGFGPFKYYGINYNQISICSNGWIAAGYTTMQTYNNVSLPTQGAPPGIIAVNWDDLYPLNGGGVWYHYDAPNHRFIVEYDSVYYYGSQTMWDKYEVIIYDTAIHTPTGDNKIHFQYKSENNYISNTVGIADPTQTIGLCYLFDGTYSSTAAPLSFKRVICFVTQGPTALSESPVNTELPISNSEIKIFARPTLFRNRTEITVSNAVANSKIAIYDRTGRLVKNLQSPKPAGEQKLNWDGTDRLGERVNAGIYFVVVQTKSGNAKTRIIRIE
jgi:hypothetical protein